MPWEIIKEKKRKWKDSSYCFEAILVQDSHEFQIEIDWVDVIYSITVTKNKGLKDEKILLLLTEFCDHNIEKYGPQLIRILGLEPERKCKKLEELLEHATLNHFMGEINESNRLSKLKKRPWWRIMF